MLTLTPDDTALPPAPAPSVAEQVARYLARLPEDERSSAWEQVVAATPGGEAFTRSWRFWGRPEQFSPGSPGAALSTAVWRWWIVVTGRGWGKTRTACEWVVDRAEAFALAPHRSSGSGRGSRLHRVLAVGPTAADCRDTMIEGESGLLAVLERRGYQAFYEPSKLRVTIPALRTVVTLRSAERPDRIRGGQYHTCWIEEFAAFPMKLDEVGESLAMANADLALRLPCPDGLQPQGVVTTTPKPIAPVKAVLDRATRAGSGYVRTSGSLYANLRNLAPAFVQAILDRYEGTKWGAQEVHGVMLEAIEGALWTSDVLDLHRVSNPPASFTRIVVAIDPYGGGSGGEAGIVVVGLAGGHVYVLADVSMAGSSDEWSSQAIAAYYAWGADTIVAEKNYGGDMVRGVIHAVDPHATVKVVTASKGKLPRAEPIAALSARGKLHLVGFHPMLESQLVSWVPGDKSPDRLDAMVWGATELFGDLTRRPASAGSPNRVRASGGAQWKPR